MIKRFFVGLYELITAVGDYLYAVMLGLWALAVTVPFAVGMIFFTYLLISGTGE